MAATVTLTGTAGPGLTLTSRVFSDVLSFNVNTVTNMVELTNSSGLVSQVSVNAATTVTATKSGFTWTLVIS